MKFWIMAMFYLSNRLGSLCEQIDKEIDRVSLSLTTDTYTLFDTVLKLEDKKIRIINFKVLGGMMEEKLKDTEKEILTRHVKGETLEEIGSSLGISKSTVSRKFLKAIETCARVAGGLTFTEQRLTEEYREIPLIYKTVQKLERKSKIRPENKIIPAVTGTLEPTPAKSVTESVSV